MRRSRNQLFLAVLLMLAGAAVLFAVFPMVRLAVDAITALLRSWGVLPGISAVFLNTLHVLALVLLLTIPLSLLVTLWMYECVRGRALTHLRKFLHGFTRVPAVLLGLLGHVLIGKSAALHESVYTMAAMLTVMALPFMISRMDVALRAVPERYLLAGQLLGGRRMDILRRIVLPQALPDIVRGGLELVERVLCEATALLVLMGAVMPNQVLATELFRLAWLGRKDAAVLAFLLMMIMMLIRLMTTRRWRSEGGERNCRYNWW